MNPIIHDFDDLKPDEVYMMLQKRGHSGEKIQSMIMTLIQSKKPAAAVVAPPKTVDESQHALPPCSECGGTVFIPTGTCHVCAGCGASQGCS